MRNVCLVHPKVQCLRWVLHKCNRVIVQYLRNQVHVKVTVLIFTELIPITRLRIFRFDMYIIVWTPSPLLPCPSYLRMDEYLSKSEDGGIPDIGAGWWITRRQEAEIERGVLMPFCLKSLNVLMLPGELFKPPVTILLAFCMNWRGTQLFQVKQIECIEWLAGLSHNVFNVLLDFSNHMTYWILYWITPTVLFFLFVLEEY